MGVFIKGRRWYIDYYLPNGKRKREVVGPVDVIDRSVAEKALKARRGEIVQGKFNLKTENKPTFFDDLLNKYLEYAKDNHEAYDRDVGICKLFKSYFRNEEISKISSWYVEQYKSKRRKDNLKPSTINRELTVLKRIFNLGIIWNICLTNPVKNVEFFKIKPIKERVLSDNEFLKLYKAASDHLKPILHTAIETGMRKGEILNLKWDNIDFENNYIYVENSKNNESRSIPISTFLKITLQKLNKNKRSGEYLFCYHEGKPIEHIYRSFNTALTISGIKKCRFHDLRHTFATRMVTSGGDIVTAKEILGHKSIIMTQRYSHPSPEHKKKAVNMISIDTSLDTKEISNQIDEIDNAI